MENSTSASDDEAYIDLDQEITSNESDCSFSTIHHSHSEKNYLRQVKKEESETTVGVDLGVKKEEQYAEEINEFKVIGCHSSGCSTNKIRAIKASWVENASGFSEAIAGNNNLSLLEEITNLKPEFLPILYKFTKVWFPVQKAVLPVLLDNSNHFLPQRDLVISSPTGSGKTLCYLLPILNKLKVSNLNSTAVFALVVAPVMNLAQQILSEFQKFNVFGARIVSLIGDIDYCSERSELFSGNNLISTAHIIVTTPGRLVEHILDEHGILNLTMLRYLVIDEADRMQDTARMEWLELVEKNANVSNPNILNLASLTSHTKKNFLLQRILVSATLTLDVHKMHIWNLRFPQLFQAQNMNVVDDSEQLETSKSIEPAIILPASLAHTLINCTSSLKPFYLFSQIQSNNEQWNRIIVFVNKRFTAHRLAILLSNLGNGNITVSEFSSKLLRNHRQKLLRNFEKGKIRVLIACDILSRGIDVTDVDCVVNYDPPINERIFVHRAGRTARANNKGLLLSMTTKDERMRLKKLLIKYDLWKNINEIRINEEKLDENALKKYQLGLKHLQNSLKQK